MINESDQAFRDSVEKCTWQGPFGHAEHIHLAWVYLRAFDKDEAIRQCAKSLQRLAESHGDFEKYHETLTVALMHLIARHVAENGPEEDWPAFRQRVRPLFKSARELLARHYSQETLDRPDARKSFVPPDREPF